MTRSLRERLGEYSVLSRAQVASVRQIIELSAGDPRVDQNAMHDLGVVSDLLEKVCDDVDRLLAGEELPIVRAVWEAGS